MVIPNFQCFSGTCVYKSHQITQTHFRGTVRTASQSAIISVKDTGAVVNVKALSLLKIQTGKNLSLIEHCLHLKPIVLPLTRKTHYRGMAIRLTSQKSVTHFNGRKKQHQELKEENGGICRWYSL